MKKNRLKLIIAGLCVTTGLSLTMAWAARELLPASTAETTEPIVPAKTTPVSTSYPPEEKIITSEPAHTIKSALDIVPSILKPRQTRARQSYAS